MKPLADRDPRVLAHVLGSLLDYQPGPKPSLRPQRAAFAPSAWMDCPGCDAGKVKRGRHVATCAQCKGAGGWKYDPYDATRKPIETTAAELYEPENLARMTAGQRAELARSAARELTDMSLPELERSLARAAVLERGDTGDAMLAALERQARYRTRTRWYRQVTEAMQGLRVVAPHHYRALVLVDVLRLESVRSLPRPWLYADGLEILGECLPADFRAPREALEAAARDAERERRAQRDAARMPAGVERDTLIVRLAANGRSLRQIAARVGMSPEGVRKVLVRLEQRDERAA